jgi:hypothetical protein
MRGLEHVLFSFLFAGENSMRGLEHVLISFYSREKILCVYDGMTKGGRKKKGFENRVFEIRAVVKYPPFRTLILRRV